MVIMKFRELLYHFVHQETLADICYLEATQFQQVPKLCFCKLLSEITLVRFTARPPKRIMTKKNGHLHQFRPHTLCRLVIKLVSKARNIFSRVSRQKG